MPLRSSATVAGCEAAAPQTFSSTRQPRPPVPTMRQSPPPARHLPSQSPRSWRRTLAWQLRNGPPPTTSSSRRQISAPLRQSSTSMQGSSLTTRCSTTTLMP
eukprot:12584951-Heterocapsa_arctica.AAC.1